MTPTQSDLGVGKDAAQAVMGDASTTPGSDAAMAPTDAAVPVVQGPELVYASGYGTDIVTFSLDAATGVLSPKTSIPASATSPSFLAMNPAQTNLYAVSEETAGAVAAYAIDRHTGALTALDTLSSGGQGPAFVSVDPTGKWVMVANYTDGTISVLSTKSDGSLDASTDQRTAGMNAHMMITDPSGAYVFVPCLGSNYVAQYLFDAASGKLTPNATPTMAVPASSAGPRHLTFAPDGKHAYLLSETSNMVSTLAFDATHGTLSILEAHSTLPSGYSGTNTSAEIHVHPSGKFVYTSNRGDDSIALFTVDATTAKLTFVGTTKTGGATPRDFTLDPSGTFLYAANQDGSSVTSFRIDPTAGTLTGIGSALAVPMASFVGVVTLSI